MPAFSPRKYLLAGRLFKRLTEIFTAGSNVTLTADETAGTITIDASGGASRSSNVPYAGREVRGRVRHTIHAGEPVVLNGEAQR